MSLRPFEILLVGAGGIGAPCALALVEAARALPEGRLRIVVADDDTVERSNLHRQILFDPSDVGRPKIEAFADAIARRAAGVVVETVPTRLLPDTARALAARADVIIDATDNFASRFLLADTAFLERVAIVHAAAVRWQATVLASAPRGGPCYRCLFEDLPEGDAPDCATAGVAGPVCGVAGALAADLALRVLGLASQSPFGFVLTYDGRRDRLRRVNVLPRRACTLCGEGATIRDIEAARYMGPACDL